MSKTTLKCIFCGSVQEGDLAVTESVCTACGKAFPTERAAKYYNSMNKLAKEEKKVAYGELYKKVDDLVEEGEFHLKNEDFISAEQKYLQALEITNVDKRIYLGLTKVYTKNFTNYSDKKHFEYLNKAISLSTKQEKDNIRAMYKAYYEVSNYTPEELAIYNEEELKQRAERTESLLKEGIPRHFKTAASIKTYKVLSPIFFIIGIITFIVGLFLKDETATFIVSTASLLFVVLALVFIVTLSGMRSRTNIYDFALDFYDNHENLGLSVKENVDCFTSLEMIAVDYLNGATSTTLENDLSELVVILANSQSTLANNFIKNYKVATKLIKEIEEEKLYE